MHQIVILSGSPSSTSRSEIALRQINDTLIYRGFSVQFFSVRDVLPETLFYARFDDPQIVAISHALRQAEGVIVGSPVYKASYTGVLKALIDLLPEDVLKDTPVLPIMVGGSGHHLLAIEFALKPLLASLKGEPLQGVYLLDRHIDKTAEPPIRDTEVTYRLHKQIEQLITAIDKQQTFLAKAQGE